MMLRSSSTPVLGSLLSSFPDSPNNNIHSETCHALKHFPPTSVPQPYHKLTCHQTRSFACGSSPISPSIGELERQNKGFRRVQSDGNLQDLAYFSCNNEERLEYLDPSKRFSARHRSLVLETIPSYSTAKHNGLSEEEEDEEMESETLTDSLEHVRVYVKIVLNQPVVGWVWFRHHWLKIEYEGLHLLCAYYGKYGHMARSCPNAVVVEIQKPVSQPGMVGMELVAAMMQTSQ